MSALTSWVEALKQLNLQIWSQIQTDNWGWTSIAVAKMMLWSVYLIYVWTRAGRFGLKIKSRLFLTNGGFTI